ncbi:MAG: 50S ribosomal protein L15 [bacterium]|nr:50S ribosomal protein L15 [bacterium]
MNLNELPTSVARSKKRLGRGIGSGKGGHTSSRGQKGQRSRNKIHPLFEGTKTKKSLIQRLPLLRGKGKQKPRHPSLIVLKLETLNVLPENSVVDVASLIVHKLVGVEAKRLGVKILAGGKLTIPLQVKLPVSKSVLEAIKKAGGQVLV